MAELNVNTFRKAAGVGCHEKAICLTIKYTAMDKYICEVCDWVYDPETGDPDNGIQPGTPFEDLPDDWVCPLCGVGKDQFTKVD